MPETPCLFGNQTAVFLKCAEIDCALESAKKPRTAGLCGRAAGACDCGPLSCAFIERVNKGRNPPKRGMAGRETSIPKGSVSHCRSRMHRAFSHIAHKRRNVRFKRLRRIHTPPQPINAHTAAHRAKHGAFQVGALSLPSDCFARFGNPARPGVRTAYFAAFGSWSRGISKNAESLRNSDALMRVAVPRRRGPAGLRDLFRFCRNCGLYALRSGPFRVCEARGGITTLSALYMLLKRRTAACQNGSFAVF